jgi:hypothetical protein
MMKAPPLCGAFVFWSRRIGFERNYLKCGALLNFAARRLGISLNVGVYIRTNFPIGLA